MIAATEHATGTHLEPGTRLFFMILIALAIAERAKIEGLDLEIASFAWDGMEAHLLEIRFGRLFRSAPPKAQA